MDERELVRRAQQGDANAFEALMQLHAQFVYNLALRTVNNSAEAEDISQEAFVRAWKALPKFRADAQFRTWLYRIVTNLCYNRLPKLKRDLQALDDDALDFVADEDQKVEGAIVTDELYQYLHAAIDKLPESYKLLITLRHLKSMSYNEIAEVTDLPLGTVKTGIFRARKELRATLLSYRHQEGKEL